MLIPLRNCHNLEVDRVRVLCIHTETYTNTDSNAETKEEEEDSTVTTARRLGILLKPQRRVEVVTPWLDRAS